MRHGLEHICDQILERVTELAVLRLVLPEFISPPLDKVLKRAFRSGSLAEWGEASVAIEKDDSKCEDIDRVSLIRLL